MKERIVRIVAGCMVLLSLVLAIVFSIQWLWLAAFVGFNLFQSAITGFCPLEMIVKKMNIQ